MTREEFELRLRESVAKRLEKIPDCYFADVVKSAEWLGVKVASGGSAATGFVLPPPDEEV